MEQIIARVIPAESATAQSSNQEQLKAVRLKAIACAFLGIVVLGEEHDGFYDWEIVEAARTCADKIFLRLSGQTVRYFSLLSSSSTFFFLSTY